MEDAPGTFEKKLIRNNSFYQNTPQLVIKF